MYSIRIYKYGQNLNFQTRSQQIITESPTLKAYSLNAVDPEGLRLSDQQKIVFISTILIK